MKYCINCYQIVVLTLLVYHSKVFLSLSSQRPNGFHIVKIWIGQNVFFHPKTPVRMQKKQVLFRTIKLGLRCVVHLSSLPDSCGLNQQFHVPHPAGVYLFNVNKRITRIKCEKCSKLIIKTPERRQNNVNDDILVSLLLTLNKFHILFYSFYC